MPLGSPSLGFVVDWLGDTVTGVGGASHHAPYNLARPGACVAHCPCDSVDDGFGWEFHMGNLGQVAM